MNQDKQDKRKDQILRAALAVIIKNGYERSRMDDVVQEAQLSKGAIYWYYKSKKDMYLDLVNFWVIRYSATINHLVEKDRSAPDQLKDLFNYFIDQYETDPDPFIALTEFWSIAQKDVDFGKKLQNVYSQFLEVLEYIVKKGVKNGESYFLRFSTRRPRGLQERGSGDYRQEYQSTIKKNKQRARKIEKREQGRKKTKWLSYDLI